MFLFNNNDKCLLWFFETKSHYQFSCYARYSSHETSDNNVACVW